MSQTEWINRGSSSCNSDVVLTDTTDGRIHVKCKSCSLEYFVRKT